MNGLLLIDKPSGITSMDVIRRVRKALGTRKAGHTGTLDPAATGLLPVTLGSCTKLAKFLPLEPKEYEFEVVFGTLTETADDEGSVVETGPSDIAEAALVDLLPRFTGPIEQTPPKYSALKVDGRRAYELARAGIPFELASRMITIHSLQLLRLADGVARMRVLCSTGTYVRALAVDLAAALGTVAHARGIRRTRVGDWTLDTAVQLADVSASDIISPLRMMSGLPQHELDPDAFVRVCHGNAIPIEVAGPDGFYAMTRDGTLLAVGLREGTLLSPRRVIAGATD